MADTESDVKGSAGSRTGMITLATAVIGAITTIAVAYINSDSARGDPKPAPHSVQPAPNNSQGQQPAPQPGTNEEPVIQPQPLMQTTRNVAGLWTAADGEQIEITQTGSQIVINGGIMTQTGVVLWQGFGRIEDRKVIWTAQAPVEGTQVEIECSGRLTSVGNFIQGTCDGMGRQWPFQYTR